MGVNTRGRLSELAARLARRVASSSRHSEAAPPVAGELRANGFLQLGRPLTAERAAELRAYFGSKLVCDSYRPERGRFLPDSEARHPESHTAHHDAVDIVRAPYLLGLANDPVILGAVADALGCRPTLGFLAAWWSYPTGVGAQHAENFHRDVDDWCFVKLFVYLSDVGPENGPHAYVVRSASSPLLREIRRFTDQEVAAAFGAGSVLRLTGKAGEGFLEDTFGIHKGCPVLVGRRLMFQAVYSMHALPYSPKEPVAYMSEVAGLHPISLNPWINRYYVHS